MSDPIYSANPGNSGSRTRSAQPRSPESRRAAERRRRARAKQRRRFQITVLSFLAAVILVSGCIGYLIGYHVGKNSAGSDPGETVNQVQSTDPLANPISSGPSAQQEEPSDKTAPQILGVNKISVFLGSTVAYRSGILVTDDTDPKPKLTVDSSLVNLSTPDIYPVIYTATDSAGNTTSVATTITVVEAPSTYVDEAIIKDKADEILSRILTEDMTPEQKVNAVYDYIENHHYYIADFDKSDYMQAAYQMMTNNRGDCFGYYAIARLFFERMGLPNLTVTRTPNEVRTTNHWWNMVSLDGGESWYHFDSTPHLTYPTRTCLVTDADLQAFNELMPNYYYYDHNSIPKTPDA